MYRTRIGLMLATWLVLGGVVSAQSSRQSQGNLSATGSVSLDITGMGTASVVISGTYSGTIAFEVIGEPGQTAVATDCAAPSTPETTVNSTTTTGTYICPVAGLRQIQARMSSYTSGTARIYINASPGGGGSAGSVSATVSGGNEAAAATGAAVPAKADYQGLNVGGNNTGATGASLGSAVAGHVAIVDGDGNQITSFGGGTEFAEDLAHTTADLGKLMLTRRIDAPASSAGSSGDYATLNTDASGNLYVAGTVTVTDGVGALNVIVDSGTLTAVTSITNPVTVTDGAGSLNVIVDSGTITTVSTVTAVTSITNAVTVTDGAGALNVIVDSGTITAVTSITNPVTVTDGSGALNVIIDSSASLAVTNAGTFVVQVDGAALTALQLIDNLPNTLGSTTSGQSGALALGAVTTASPSYTNAQTNALSLDESGSLRVAIISGAGSGGTAMTDDAAFTAGTTSITPIGAMFDDSATDSVNENDGGVVRMSGNRNLYVNLRDNAGNERGLNIDASGNLSVTGITNAVTVTDGSGALNIICDSGCSGGTQYAEDAAHASGNTGTLALVVRNDAGTALAGDGDNIPLMVNSSGALYVAGTVTVTDGVGALNTIIDSGTITAVTSITNAVTVNSHAVTNAGTFAVQVDGNALTALQLIDNIVSVEDAVAGSAFSGVGILAVRQDSQSDLAADGDFIPMTVDADGGLRVSIVAGAGSGGTAQADDADFTDGTTSGTPIGGVAESASPTTVTEGDFGWAAITLNRALKVTLYTAAGSEITTGTDYTHNAALTADSSAGPLQIALAKDFDASALPNVVSAEGDAVSTAASLYGVQYVMVVNEDGSLERGTATTPTIVGDGSGALNVIVDSGTITVSDGSGALNTIIDSGTVTTVSTVTTLSQLGGQTVPVEDAAETVGGSGIYAMSVMRTVPTSSTSTTGDNATINTNASGALWVSSVDPCSSEAKTRFAISHTSDQVLISAAASKKNYICSIVLVAGAAEIVNIVEGTGSTCATSTAAIAGSTTEANGLSFAANGGFSAVGGDATVIPGSGTNVDTCLFISGSNRVSGFITYVQR
jgi:hypothetical protein